MNDGSKRIHFSDKTIGKMFLIDCPDLEQILTADIEKRHFKPLRDFAETFRLAYTNVDINTFLDIPETLDIIHSIPSAYDAIPGTMKTQTERFEHHIKALLAGWNIYKNQHISFTDILPYVSKYKDQF